jgi:hypothetical protein
MSVLGRDYERIAMCAHSKGTHEHVPLKPGEDPPETCFADCDCKPVVFVRADLHARAVATASDAISLAEHLIPYVSSKSEEARFRAEIADLRRNLSGGQ